MMKERAIRILDALRHGESCFAVECTSFDALRCDFCPNAPGNRKRISRGEINRGEMILDIEKEFASLDLIEKPLGPVAKLIRENSR